MSQTCRDSVAYSNNNKRHTIKSKENLSSGFLLGAAQAATIKVNELILPTIIQSDTKGDSDTNLSRQCRASATVSPLCVGAVQL